MSHTDPTGHLAGEPYGFRNGDVDEGPPQRFAGRTLPATDEAVRDRGARHIEMEA